MKSLATKHKLDPHETYSMGLLHSLANAVSEAHEEELKRQLTDPFGHLNSRLMSIGSADLN